MCSAVAKYPSRSPPREARPRCRRPGPRVANADLYRVRLYAADGTLGAQRELVDTSLIALRRDSIPLPRQATAFWEVQALDHLRQPVARSNLTKAVTSDLRP